MKQRQTILSSQSTNILQNNLNYTGLQKSVNSPIQSSDDISPDKINFSPTKSITYTKSRSPGLQISTARDYDILDVILDTNSKGFHKQRSMQHDQILEKWELASVEKKSAYYVPIQTSNQQIQSQHKNDDGISIRVRESRKLPNTMIIKAQQTHSSVDTHSHQDIKTPQISSLKYNYLDSVLHPINKSLFSKDQEQDQSQKPLEQKKSLQFKQRGLSDQTQLKEVVKHTMKIPKKILIQLDKDSDIEDFFKIDINFVPNQKLGSRKTLQNIYRLVSFTQWVENIYGKSWFQEESKNQFQISKRIRNQKVNLDEFLKGLNFE